MIIITNRLDKVKCQGPGDWIYRDRMARSHLFGSSQPIALVSYAQAWFTEVTGHDDELMGLMNLVEDDRLRGEDLSLSHRS